MIFMKIAPESPQIESNCHIEQIRHGTLQLLFRLPVWARHLPDWEVFWTPPVTYGAVVQRYEIDALGGRASEVEAVAGGFAVMPTPAPSQCQHV